MTGARRGDVSMTAVRATEMPVIAGAMITVITGAIRLVVITRLVVSAIVAGAVRAMVVTRLVVSAVVTGAIRLMVITRLITAAIVARSIIIWSIIMIRSVIIVIARAIIPGITGVATRRSGRRPVTRRALRSSMIIATVSRSTVILRVYHRRH